MKTFTFTFLCFIFSLQLFAQGAWEIISPYPTINDLHKIYFVNDQTGWAVGAKGTIVYTNDGGDTWDWQYKDDFMYFTDVFFVDENEGWVVGWHDVLHTVNGGDTWEKQNLPGFLDVESVYFINHDTGWIVGTYKTIYKTIDGGQTWLLKLSGDPSAPALVDLYFSDYLHGVAVGGDWFSYEDDAFVLVTADGGETWTETTPAGTDELKAISFISPETGWACGYGNDILKTNDGGYTWEVVSSIVNSKDDICFFDDNNGIILSGSLVFTTNDGGVTWNTVQTNMVSMVSSFSFAGSTGFAAGYYGYLFKSSDYGETWEESGSHRYGSVEKLFFTDENNGWAKNYSSKYLYQTNDGGYSWEPKDVGATFALSDYCFPSATTGYAVEYSDRLFKSVDAGQTWEQIDIGYSNNIKFIYFVNDQKGFIGGADGFLLKTINGGATWTLNSIPGYGNLIKMLFLDEQNGWLLRYSGKIYKTNDGGDSWEEKAIGGSANLSDFCFLDNQKGFVTSLLGKLFMTEDGGETWEQVFAFSQYSNSVKVSFVTDSEGWLIVGSKLYYTIDGGYNWAEYSHPNYLMSMFFLNENKGWLSGSYSFMMQYTNQTTGMQELPSAGFDVFPNPTNGIVYLSLPEIQGDHKMINVFNIGGQLCRSYNVTGIKDNMKLDLTSLPYGMYVIELRTPGNSMTVKVLKQE